MKAEEVVALLQANIPPLNSSFSTNVSVVSIENLSGNIATVTTSTDHNLSIGNIFSISGAQSNIVIDTLTRNGIVGTLVTDEDHDITNGLKTIEISGAIEPNFNGTFTIQNVDNRRTIRFLMDDSGATIGTGAPLLINGQSVFRGYNGVYPVASVIDSTQFTYVLESSGLEPATGTIVMSNKIRISAGGTIERLVEGYTKKPDKNNWMFVVLNDVIGNKSRRIQSDAVNNLNRGQQGEGFRQQIFQSFSVYVLIPTSQDFTARKARDESEDIFENICQSILFYRFDSGLAATGFNGSLAFTNHGIFAYNAAYYIHQYVFEQVVDLTFLDTVGYDEDVAFRDISLIMNQSTGNETFTAEINLDEAPL